LGRVEWGNSFLYGIDIYIYDLSISIIGWVGLGWVGSGNLFVYEIDISAKTRVRAKVVISGRGAD
jgi:hypothetical protein